MTTFGTVQPGCKPALQAAWAGAHSEPFVARRPKPVRSTKGNIMADENPLAGLLDRAGKVFFLAGELGRAFHEKFQRQGRQIDPADLNHHAPTFNKYCAALLDLRDAMQNPPDGFATVAKPLLEAARSAKDIRDTLQRPDSRNWAAYLEFFPRLNSVCEDGWRAVKEVTKARRLDDPFAFVDKAATPAFSLLDRFPATPAGHVAFLEFVRDEVHQAAEAKRRQLEQGYPNATIESMVRGIKWAEAGARLAALSTLPEMVRKNVGDTLHRQLTVGTVEQIDNLLIPAISELRNQIERSRAAEQENNSVIVTTAGDFWKALAEGKRPCSLISAISMKPGANTAEFFCPNPADEARRTALDRARALVTAEGGDKAAAIEKLIARVQLQVGMDKASVINMPLADFVAAAMKAVANPQVAQLTDIEPMPEARAERLMKPCITGAIADAYRGVHRPNEEPKVVRQQAAKPKRRGRKKANYETEQKEAALVADWQRVRDAGGYKPDFAKDHGMSVKQLDTLLDRVAKRNRHSE